MLTSALSSRRSWWRLAVLAVLLATCSSFPARTAELAPVGLLNFTSRRVDAGQVAQFSRNLREAFMLSGQVKMLEELTMKDTLTGEEGANRLKQARGMLSESKKAFKNRDYDGALQKLEGARAVHRALYSEVSHPDELADVLLFQGLTLVQKQKPDLAQVTFLQMVRLSPAMDVSKAPGISPEAVRIVADARKQAEDMPLKGVNAAFAGEIASKLGVSHLVTGMVEAMPGAGQVARAQVTLQVVAPGKREPETIMQFELDDISSGLPPAGAPIYQKIVGISTRALAKP